MGLLSEKAGEEAPVMYMQDDDGQTLHTMISCEKSKLTLQTNKERIQSPYVLLEERHAQDPYLEETKMLVMDEQVARNKSDSKEKTPGKMANSKKKNWSRPLVKRHKCLERGGKQQASKRGP